ncbi:MAG: NYN domain-containing protein [Ilumatobacteraceae bacterium]|nr:NYN domain-containing protein [Actinomycetota bacterium]MCO5329724.1 NYN domain-containing protein [Ilumatobacteraceae bacterium]
MSSANVPHVSTPRPRTIVYIDGLNFYYGAVAKFPELKWVDFEKFARLLVPNDDLIKVRYFTAQVKPRYPGDRSSERQNVLLRAVRTNPLIEVELGHFRADVKSRAIAGDRPTRSLFRPHLRPHTVMRGVWWDNARRRAPHEPAMVYVRVMEEKGSDVNLGAWLVHDALNPAGRLADKAIVVTNDSDLATPLRLARESGVQVGLVNPHDTSTARKLRTAADFEIPFRREALAKCQLPNVVRTSKGKEIHRPAAWR